MTDANRNGLDDFFEVSQSVVSAETQGHYFTFDAEEGTLHATWSRPAGSVEGQCQIQLIGGFGALLPQFTVNFELLEYTGSFRYQPDPANVAGRMELNRTQNAAQQLSGELILSKSGANRLNELTLKNGSLRNALGQTLGYETSFLQRSDSVPTRYRGLVEFTDGDPATVDDDYVMWELIIEDPHDADGDGVPDLSDDSVATPLRQTKLRLELDGESATLRLYISGEIGKTVDVDHSASLDPPTWIPLFPVSLVSDPQSVSLSLGTDRAQYFRLRVR